LRHERDEEIEACFKRINLMVLSLNRLPLGKEKRKHMSTVLQNCPHVDTRNSPRETAPGNSGEKKRKKKNKTDQELGLVSSPKG